MMIVKPQERIDHDQKKKPAKELNGTTARKASRHNNRAEELRRSVHPHP